MDRFVWFVLLVVFSHLVTEFTRVTGYTRGSRHDSVMVNDSLIRPIRVQNQIQYPGQEYGHQPDLAYYNGNSHYNNYDNNNQISDGSSNINTNTNANANTNNNNNMFSNFFRGLFNQNNNNNNNSGNNNGQDSTQTYSNIDIQPSDVRTLGFVQPIIDSIFEIPISTLRAVNNLVGRLTFSNRRQQQQQQQQPQQQQQHEFSNHLLPPQQQQQALQQQYSPSFTSSPSAASALQPPYYGIQRSATIPPKSEFEMLERIRQLDNSNNNDQQHISQKPTTASL